MSTGSPCHEETIYLPTWTNNLCWFLSMNLALFHKPIDEFKTYNPDVKGEFEKTKEAETLLKTIIQHYSDPKKEKNDDKEHYKNISSLISNENVAKFFNNQDFTISGGSQTAEEYLVGLQKTQLFQKFIATISVGHDFMNIDAMNWDILMSIDLNKPPSKRQNGLAIEEYNYREVLKGDNKLESVRTEKSVTPLLFLVQTTSARGQSLIIDSEINILESITVPAEFLWKIDPNDDSKVKEKSNEFKCNLISILENAGSSHYNCAIKCSDPGSTVWYFYGGGLGPTGGGTYIKDMDTDEKKKITFANFDELLNDKDYSRLKKTSVFLVYEVVVPVLEAGTGGTVASSDASAVSAASSRSAVSAVSTSSSTDDAPTAVTVINSTPSVLSESKSGSNSESKSESKSESVRSKIPILLSTNATEYNASVLPGSISEYYNNEAGYNEADYIKDLDEYKKELDADESVKGRKDALQKLSELKEWMEDTGHMPNWLDKTTTKKSLLDNRNYRYRYGIQTLVGPPHIISPPPAPTATPSAAAADAAAARALKEAKINKELEATRIALAAADAAAAARAKLGSTFVGAREGEEAA